MAKTDIVVCIDEALGIVSPLLHSQFSEHLGRCCYDGLWVGENSAIPNIKGFRKDIIDALNRLGVPMLRWPGGCFADSYHWRNGIGPVEERPRTLSESCGLRSVETNQLGTHEFMDLCKILNCKPYISGNIGSGSPEEFCDWVHYCNLTVDTTLVRERIANGSELPFGVQYWGVGNETWACGGNYDPFTYGHEFKRYATFLKQVDPTIQLVACGDHDRNWNQRVMEANQWRINLMDHLSVHRYNSAGHSTEFTEDEYYQMLRGADIIEEDIRCADDIIRFYTPGPHKIKIAFDEWGAWHSDATSLNNYEAPSTMRDAVMAAGVLDVFNRWCDRLSMAQIAQVVNVLHCLIKTSEDKMCVTPTYHVFELYAPHRTGVSLKTVIEDCPVKDMPAIHGRFPVPKVEKGEMALVSASASKKDNMLAISISNRHYNEPMDINLTLRGGTVHYGKKLLISSPKPNDHNTCENPSNVSVACSNIELNGGQLDMTIPPCSICSLLLQP